MSHFGTPLRDFHPDATLDCACALPLFPVAREAAGIRYEGANAHTRVVEPPAEARLRRLIDSWIDKRSSQLEAQHRRWDTDD